MKGQCCFVTGAGSGIGAELVRGLLQRGASVTAADINLAGMEPLRSLAAPGQLRCISLDVRDPARWKQCLDDAEQEQGPLSILINVAGVINPGYIADFTAEDVHRQLDVNAKGVIFGTQAAARLMLKRGAGQIINFASLAGVAPVPGLALYSASKFAVRGYSLAAAFELRERGVKLTVICPDAVQTPMLDQQVGREEAALTFSGKVKPLTVADVALAVFEEALPKAPLEICLPKSRGVMAKLASAFPQASLLFMPSFRERGYKAQRQKLKSKSGP